MLAYIRFPPVRNDLRESLLQDLHEYHNGAVLQGIDIIQVDWSPAGSEVADWPDLLSASAVVHRPEL